MHDDIARVDQDPVALWHALDPQIAETLRLEPLDELIGKSALAVEIDRGDVFSLGVIEAG